MFIIAKNCLKLDFQGIKFIRIMQLSPGVLPSHKCFNEQISPFKRIYHLIFMIRGYTFTTSTENEQFCDPLPTPHPQKWTIDLLFKNNRI